MRRLFILVFTLAATSSLALAGGTCPGDVTGDGVVDVEDMVDIIVNWGTNDGAADINGDGFVDVQDLTAVVLDWGCVQTPLAPLSGTVVNLWTGMPIAGASVVVGNETLVTDGDGDYAGEFPPGQYTVEFEATNFIAASETIILFPGVPNLLDFALQPVAQVVVTVEIDGDTGPGGTAMATAVVTILDGFSTVNGFSWTQIAGSDAVISGAETDTVSVDLADVGVYKARLIQTLLEPPIGPEQLPPNVPPPPGEFTGGLQSRFQVVGLNPFVLEQTGLVALEVEVNTTSGVYTADGELHTQLPWKTAGGIRNVPINAPVLFYGKDQPSYDWALDAPGASQAELIDATTRNPEFTPDVAGIYDVTVTDDTTGPVTFEIFAGNWQGVVTGQDEDGRPVADATCVACHQLLGVDRFTPWAQTGHAEIFTDNLNTSPYWGPQCFQCHTVGYDLTASNNGIDETVGYQAFLNSGLIGNPSANNWTTMLEQFPSTALQANVQCENCHGPQWGLPGVTTLAHGPVNPIGEPRQSLSSDVCATCHGEPLRHARFQQWQLSGHADYEVAIDEGGSGNCSRCHTVNGFLTWLPILLGDQPGDPLDNITVTWTEDEIHPQTCITCHDPHNTGSTSGIDTDATVRISGDTPELIAGFTAYGVGRGAMCMTCHNSRRGLRNDSTFDQYYGTSEAARAPHGSAQTDLIMGENAYLVTTGVRGGHSFITDTCVRCHMEETPPPGDLAYNLSGTNHTFYAANTICTQCHIGIDGPSFQGGVESTLHVLQDAVEAGLLDLIASQIDAGNVIDLDGEAQISSVGDVQEIVFGESRGRQAITVTFSDDTTLGPYRLNDVTVLDESMVVLGQLYDFADPGLIKAGWNWGLVHNDGSLGAHNPTFAYTALSAGINAVDPAAAAQVQWPDWLAIDPAPAHGNAKE